MRSAERFTQEAKINMPAVRVNRRVRYQRIGAIAIILLILAFGFLAFIHPLLAVTARVDADVLVVEGWVPEETLVAAVREFKTRHYHWLVASGLRFPPETPGSYAEEAALTLKTLGVPANQLLALPADRVDWYRTSTSARGVRDGLKRLGIQPTGINVMTAGPHARETWIAYRRIMRTTCKVGIISIPVDEYDSARWWTTPEGRQWVLKNVAAWAKEALIGQRS